MSRVIIRCTPREWLRALRMSSRLILPWRYTFDPWWLLYYPDPEDEWMATFLVPAPE